MKNFFIKIQIHILNIFGINLGKGNGKLLAIASPHSIQYPLITGPNYLLITAPNYPLITAPNLDLTQELDFTKALELKREVVDKKAQYIFFTLINKHLLDGKDLVYAIHHFLFKNKDFLAFGSYKVIFISAGNEQFEFNFHTNVLVKNTTSFLNYFDKIKDTINVKEYAYDSTAILYLFIKIWNVDDFRNKKN